MHKILLPINTKSLYFNILNDNKKGHTCTVATPIKQGNSFNDKLAEIYKVPKQIDFETSDELLNDLTKNSKSISKINNVFVFDKFKVNGIELNCDSSYCMYIKEEIDKTKEQFGRIKLHYPLSLKNDKFNINNKNVINSISNLLNDYAFIVESFEYDFDTDYLNFNVLIVGYNNIPYSKVFINNKGTGSKYNSKIKNYIDVYDSEIIALRNVYDDEINTSSFDEYMNSAYKKSKELVFEYLQEKGAKDIRIISNDYPYSLFDLQYFLNEKFEYGLLFATYTNKIYLELSSHQNRFINLFDNVKLYVVKNIEREEQIIELSKDDLDDFSILPSSIRFLKD